jgi:predicted TIM-barrel fold metal-dependent hydrolase
MGSGLFDEYPNLNLILGHLGEALPCNIWRIDNRVSRTLGDRPKAKHPIGHYLGGEFLHHDERKFPDADSDRSHA